MVGEGKMGTSIFFYLNGFNFRLAWLVSSEAAKEKAQKLFSKKTKILLQSGILTETEYALKIEKTTITDAVVDLSDCDLVIEAITEDIGMKRKLFDSLDRAVNTDCIFATNSSSLLPSQLNPANTKEDRTCGLHFFFPVAMKNMVEVITNQSTSLEVKESLHHFLVQINKSPFHQDEANAFILNRLFLDFQAGAYQIFMERKLSYEEIDELVRLYLFPIGVFEFFDHVGIDVMLASIRTYSRSASNKEFYAPLIDKMEELVRLNHLGIKTKRGFYDYASREENDRSEQGDEKQADSYRKDVLQRLWNYFISTVNTVVGSGIISRDDLAEAVRDYMGMEGDPFLFRGVWGEID